MSVAVTEQETLTVSEDDLQNDPRWLLVRRMLKTESFHRAEQLRKIMVYVSSMAILRPGQVVREYDIAFNALGRRQDFDPAQDNILRVQLKNLRQRIDRYFLDEGKDEPLIVNIPKGVMGLSFPSGPRLLRAGATLHSSRQGPWLLSPSLAKQRHRCSMKERGGAGASWLLLLRH